MQKALLAAVLAVGSLLTAKAHAYTPTITQTRTVSATITQTKTISATITITPTRTPTATISATRTITLTVTPTFTLTPAYSSPDLSTPKVGPGKALYDENGLQLQLVSFYGLASCGPGASAAATSPTSAPINLTFTVARSTSSPIPYFGPLTIYLVNTGLSTAVAWVGMTPTAMISDTPAGLVVKAGEGGMLYAPNRSGLTLHLQGLTDTTAVSYTICTN